MKKISIGLLVLLVLLAMGEIVIQSHWVKEITRNFLMEKLEKSGFSVSIEKIEGTFPSAVVLKNIDLQSDQLSLSMESVELNLSLFGLLKKELIFSEFKARGIQFEEKSTPSKIGSKSNQELPFAIKIKHFQLEDLTLPHFFKAHLEGKFSLSRKKKLFLDTTLSRTDFPTDLAHLTVTVTPKGMTQIQAHLNTTTLQAANIQAPFDMTSDIHINMRGPLSSFLEKKGKIRGKIRGKMTPRSTSLDSPLQPFVEKDWIFSAHFARKDSKEWTLSRLNAKSHKDTLQAKATLNENGKILQAAIKVHSNTPQIDVAIALNSLDHLLQGKAIVRSPLLSWNDTQIQSIGTNTEFSWDGKSLKGNTAGSAEVFSKIWTGHFHFSWNQGGSLFLPEWHLQSSSIHLKGDLEIKTDQTLLGQVEANIENLQDLSPTLYGSLKVKSKWLEEKAVEIDGKFSNFYYKELFSPSISFYSDLKNPFQKVEGNVYFDIELLKWHSLFLETTTLEITSDEKGLYPFKLFTEGEWKHPLELHLDGLLNYSESSLLCTLENTTGSFFKHPITLSHPINLEIAPTLLHIPDLDLKVGNGNLLVNWDRKEENTTAQLKLENFPLDVLSLNPLDLAIEGRTNIQLDLTDIKNQLSANFKASIEELNIASLEDPDLVKASGIVQGNLEKDQLDLKANLDMKNAPLLSCNLSLPIHLELYPFQTQLLFDNPVKGDLAFNGKIEEILDFFNLGTHYLKGNCDCKFQLSRTLNHPNLEGYCHLENGYYENYFTGTQINKIQAKWRAKKGSLILDSLSGKDGMNKGNITATGEISLQYADLFPFHFETNFQEFNSVQIDLVTVETNGHLEIDGNLKSALAKGEIAVLKSDLLIPSHVPRSYPKLDVVYLNPTQPMATKTPSTDLSSIYPLFLDLSVRAPDAIFISGRGLNSEWKGDFHIGGTNTAIATEGKLELLKGNFLLSGRSFKLTEGALSFTGRPGEMPYLNLAGSMDVKDISIIARLKGPLNDPQITLQSLPQLPLSTIMAYLLFGQNLAEINSYQALQLANSLASLAGEGPDVLENARRSLGIDRLTITTTPSEDDELSDTIAVQVGKYISDGILVSFTQGAEDSSTNISIEVEMKHGFVLQLESDQKQNQGIFTLKWNHNY